MKLLDNVLGGNTDGADEELGLLLDDDVDELVKGTLGVVVVGLAGAATDLGDEEVDTERKVGLVEALLDLLDDGAEVLGAGVSRVREALSGGWSGDGRPQASATTTLAIRSPT